MIIKDSGQVVMDMLDRFIHEVFPAILFPMIVVIEILLLVCRYFG